MTSLAPVVLFAYKRPDTTRRVLEGISKTEVEKLYIFVDGPKHEMDIEAVTKVVRLAKAADFCETSVVVRDKNIGLARSIHDGVSQVFKEHESLLVLEDDILVTPDFTTVLSVLLEKYKSHPRVLSVSGYAPPIDVPERYPYSFYFTRRVSTWGWGTWRDRWAQMPLLDDTVDRALMSRMMVDVAPDMALLWTSLIEKAWSLTWMLRGHQRRMLTAWPTRSLVQNIGFDDLGTNCSGDTSRLAATDFWDAQKPLLLPKEVRASELALRAFNALQAPDPSLGRKLRLAKLRLTGKPDGQFAEKLLQLYRRWKSMKKG